MITGCSPLIDTVGISLRSHLCNFYRQKYQSGDCSSVLQEKTWEAESTKLDSFHHVVSAWQWCIVPKGKVGGGWCSAFESACWAAAGESRGQSHRLLVTNSAAVPHYSWGVKCTGFSCAAILQLSAATSFLCFLNRCSLPRSPLLMWLSRLG